MVDDVQRLRRDLAGEVPAPVWPAGVRLRGFAAGDAPAVHRLMRRAYAAGGGEVGDFEQWWPGLRDDGEFDPDLVFLAVESDGGLVGAALCWTSAFIKDLVVQPEARRRGIGEALLLTAFRAFRDRGAPHVDLKVQAHNPTGALRLYRRVGMSHAPSDG